MFRFESHNFICNMSEVIFDKKYREVFLLQDFKTLFLKLCFGYVVFISKANQSFFVFEAIIDVVRCFVLKL